MKKYVLVLSILVLQACATYTPIRESSSLVEKSGLVRSVVVLPADVDINLIEVSGSVDIPEMDAQYKKEAENIVQTQLSLAGLRVLKFDFDKQMEADADFAFSVTQCKQAMQTLKKDLYAKPVTLEKKATFTNSIADAANPVAAYTGADMVAYVNYGGFKKSAGKKAAELTTAVIVTLLTGSTPISPAEASGADLVLVEAATGDLLWANSAGSARLDTSPVNALFTKFPVLSWGSKRTDPFVLPDYMAIKAPSVVNAQTTGSQNLSAPDETLEKEEEAPMDCGAFTQPYSKEWWDQKSNCR